MSRPTDDLFGPGGGPVGKCARLVWRLKIQGVICASETAPDIRRAILDAGVQVVTYGRCDNGRAGTYADRFADVFGEPLIQTKKAKRC